MDTILQLGTDRYAPIVAHVADYHAEKMQRAGFAWRGVFQRSHAREEWHSRQKLEVLSEQCENAPDGSRVALADADSLNIGPEVFPPQRPGVPWNVAAVRNHYGQLNTANLFLVNCQAVRDVLRASIAKTHIPEKQYSDTWSDQQVFNWELRFHPGLQIENLNCRWNYYHGAKGVPSFPIHWIGFHDQDKSPEYKFHMVKQALAMVKEGRTFNGGAWV